MSLTTIPTQRRMAMATLLALAAGCSSTKAIPVNRLPAEFLAIPRADKEPINFIRLRQDPPPVYQLGPRDVLGIYIEGILGQSDQAPPVHFPERDAGMPPAIGFPIPVREDGTISLPLIPYPLRVSGLTLTQAEELIRDEYVNKHKLLPPGRDRTIVTLIRKRTYQVLVIREDSVAGGGGAGELVGAGLIQRGAARAVDLKAYENDVLHALTETGGMPGLDAKPVIVIIRGAFADAQGRASILADLDDGKSIDEVVDPRNPNVLRIPLRRRPSDPPVQFDEEDIILATGDIVYIENREREVFYTGGLLQGREQLLPRDYDLDILGALAVSGGSVASAPGSGGGGQNFFNTGGGSINPRGLIPPTDCIVVRKVQGGYQIPIKVNIRRALTSPGERILIQPGDLVILQYTPMELIANILLNNFQVNYFLNNIGR